MQNLTPYDRATKQLMKQAMNMDVPRAKNGMHLVGIVRLLRECFKCPTTYTRVFGGIAPARGDPSAGFCLVSNYYIYNNIGGDNQWQLMKTENPRHWWLEHKQYGTFDITYTQFNNPIQYRNGIVENRIKTDADFLAKIQRRAHILGQCAGLEA